MKWKMPFAVLAATLSLSTVTVAQEIDPSVFQSKAYGINRDSAQLKFYDFTNNSSDTVGIIKDEDGTTMSGIDGAAYIPGYSNIIGFWKEGALDTRLVYINSETAHGARVGQGLGAGKVTGAVATMNGNAVVSGGLININPNNNDTFEFSMITDTGLPLTRDDLKKDLNLTADGILHQGGAFSIRVKPKGNGNQNGAIIDGQAVTLQNGKQYTFVGDMQVTLFNDHIVNTKAMGHWWIRIDSGKAYVLEDGNMIAGGTTGASPWAVYAVQNVVEEADEPIDFVVDEDSVVPSEPYALKLTVLGAAISNGGYYDMPVTTKFKVGGAVNTPFGNYTQAVSGNVNDGQNPRSYVFPGTFAAGTSVDIIGQSWVKKKSQFSGNSNNHWQTFHEIDGSNSNSPYIKVLRNGDAVPNITGFMDQNAIEDFVEEYIDVATNTIKLEVNEAIFLFELGVTDLSSPAADFQDLVVLVTLAADPDDFDDVTPGAGPKSRLLKVNHQTGGYSQLMMLQNEYDGLASRDGITFYATRENKLYEINLAAQTETLAHTLTRDKLFGLECVGDTLMGFEVDGDKLVPWDVSSGSMIGSPAEIEMNDLGSLIFMPAAIDPAVKPKAYD